MVFCNKTKRINYDVIDESHNPYFNRWFSAITFYYPVTDADFKSQSLF